LFITVPPLGKKEYVGSAALTFPTKRLEEEEEEGEEKGKEKKKRVRKEIKVRVVNNLLLGFTSIILK
jgi:uncharacterized protein YqhQ